MVGAEANTTPPDPVTADPNAVATPVPRPETPVEIGKPVALVSVPLKVEDHAAVPPLTVRIWPVVPMARFVVVLPLAPTTMVPSAVVVWPVPPPAIGTCPHEGAALVVAMRTCPVVPAAVLPIAVVDEP